ncbi:hypothetical protein ED312_08740 [Sinomicrobium pectinilyticum]|uniref:Uncharacterized protein n=1 Tax=Sinomicrobium pectinilyticum TaxID=1084421 RepID=A0A3N0EL48_SINP1|nr:hypothetical protein [Sinomicrobium pectinilyticum]RNL88524.1 hypothetical protein ED312_08740 [Sinomicrobium pectinilyticum]
MLEIQKNIYDFIVALDYEIKADNLHFSYDANLEDYLKRAGIEFEKVRTEEINIDYSNLGFKVFENANDYLTEGNVRKEGNILILNFDETTISRIDNNSYVDFELKESFYFFSNAKNYLDFIDFLKAQDQETEDAFHFIDYANGINRKIVLTSLTEKSRLILKYYKEIPNFSSKIDYSRSFNQFKNCFAQENQNLPKFLKSSLIKYASRCQYNERTKLVFENLSSIVDDAKMTFEIFINNLSIDKIRKDYDDYKSQYFNEVAEILKKITQQIIGFPVVIASTLFAIEKVKGNPIFLWILAGVILITTVYLILLLNMNYKDLDYVKHLSDRDYDSIKGNNFFVKFPDEFVVFQKIKNRISTRIRNLLIVCESYFWILGVSNTIMICLMLHHLEVPNMGIVFIGLAILTIMIITRNKIWDEKSVT